MKVFGMKKNEKTDMNIKDADARRRSRLTYFVFLQFLHLWLILRAEKVAIAGRNCPALRKSLSMRRLTRNEERQDSTNKFPQKVPITAQL